MVVKGLESKDTRMIKELVKIANELDERGLCKEAGVLDELVSLIAPVNSAIRSGIEGTMDSVERGAGASVTALVTMSEVCKWKEVIFGLLDAAKIARMFSKEKSEALIIGSIAKGAGLSKEKVIMGLELLEKHFGLGMKEIFEQAEAIKAVIRGSCKMLEEKGLLPNK